MCSSDLDVPSAALGPNEYNSGTNVETDVRGIRSMAGDQEILNTVPGTPTFITGGFRLQGEFWFIVATVEGIWYASNGTTDWYDITPGGVPIDGYDQATNITEAWNGTIPFFNDFIGAPMFWPDEPGAIMVQYSNLIIPHDINDIVYVDPTTMQIQLVTAYDSAPYIAGQKITISGVNNYFNGTFTVVSSTTTTIDYLAVPGASYPGGPLGSVAPAYTWNYNPNWKSVVANFLRIYSTPNVGSILVAGDLTATDLDDVVTNYPVTVQWSQAFGLNQAPSTWEPTITNIANQVEVPLRGPALDSFPSNGQFFLCSFWDTVVFSPINYSTTSAPILGIRQFNQGRGLLSANCWANTDKLVYGLDARDVWVFDGQDFQGLGNQRVKNWLFDQLDPQYYGRVFMEVNSQRSQVEIYYPDKDAIDGVPNKMLSYRYDLDCWNSPRDVESATFSCESPIFTYNDPNYDPLYSSRTVVYARGVADSKLVQKDQGYSFIATEANPDGNIASEFRRDNIKLLKDYSGKLMVHRILPEVVNIGAIQNDNNNIPITPGTGNLTVTLEGANSVGSSPTISTAITVPVDANGSESKNPWAQFNQNAFRVNSIILSDTSNASVWLCSATTWQATQVEDDR